MTPMKGKQEAEDGDKDAAINGRDERLPGNNGEDRQPRDERPPELAALALKNEPAASGEVEPTPLPPPPRAAAAGRFQLAVAPTKRATKVIAHIS